MQRFGDRYRGSALRFPTGYGPRMSSRTPEIPPPDGGNLLFDWNPAIDPYRDLAGGLPITNNGVTFEFQRGAVCGVFDGSSYLVSTGSPFAALSDLTACSIYVVMESTGTPASIEHLVSIEDSTANTFLNSIYLQLQADNDLAMFTQDGVSGSLDTNFARPARNTQYVASGHATLTTLEAVWDGATATPATVTSRDPSGLNRVIIGAIDSNLGISYYFTGRIWRVLIYDAPYNADVVDGL